MRSGIAVLVCVIFAPLVAHAQSEFAVKGALQRLQSRADTTERELRETVGRMEVLGFELNQTKNLLEQNEKILQEILRRQSELEARLKTLESRPATEPSPSPSPSPPDPSPSPSPSAQAGSDGAPSAPTPAPKQKAGLPDNPEQLLESGRSHLFRNEYRAAELALRKFSEQYQQHAEIGEAKYLLAETLLSQRSYPEAAAIYIELLSNHPDSPSAPEGLVKLARVMRLMEDRQQACAILAELPLRYPSAAPAIGSIASAERDRAGCS